MDEKYQKVINTQASFDNDFKRKIKENKKLGEEFKRHKKDSKSLLEEKNLLIRQLEDRVKELIDLKHHEVSMIDKQREELEDELSIVKSKLKILELKENFYKNKAENLIKQKNFLVVQITNILESMNIEYNRIHDLESQKDFMISVKKSNKNIQEVYFKGINDMRYFKQIIEFMNFNEFETANDILKVQEDQELNESEMPLSSNSNNTSFVSEIKEESFGDSRQDTVLNKRPNVIPVKKSETSIVNKIEIGKMKERKQTSTNVLYKDITLSKGGKTEVS